MSRKDHDVAISQQGHYAGSVTRLVAYVIDYSLATTLFSMGTAVLVWVLSLVTDGDLNTTLNKTLVGVLYFVWLFIYFAYPWSVSGKTPGMAVFGIRVVRADGSHTTPRNGVVRTLAFPLSFLLLGLGFLGILIGKQRRALHDSIAGTAVVYDWDARGARLRFLARRAVEAPVADPGVEASPVIDVPTVDPAIDAFVVDPPPPVGAADDPPPPVGGTPMLDASIEPGPSRSAAVANLTNASASPGTGGIAS